MVRPTGLALALAAAPLAAALHIAAAFSVVEYTPLLVARDDFYKGGPVTFSNGGVADLVAAAAAHDLAGNAETQALRQFAGHRNLRIIYTVAEVAYRLVASRAAGVTALADLRGKRIGTMAATSAAYFAERLLASAGLAPGTYTLVSAAPCNTPPCAADTLPGLLRTGAVDAVALWEPTAQLALDALGGPAFASVFQNRSVYREVYNLHSTAERLADPVSRGAIVAFVRALNEAVKLFQNTPEVVLPRVAAAVNVSVPTLREVWADHDWSGPRGLPKDLLDVLTEEEKWVAAVEKRAVVPREALATLIDDSVFKEAFPA